MERISRVESGPMVFALICENTSARPTSNTVVGLRYVNLMETKGLLLFLFTLLPIVIIIVMNLVVFFTHRYHFY